MFVKSVDLYEYFGVKKPENAVGILTEYVLGRYEYCPERVRPAMLVIAGGGYSYVSRREMEPIAIAYVGKGFNCYTLDYSVEVAHPVDLIEASMAMAYIREKAEEHATNSEKVSAIGFSAGGHLCTMLGTMFDTEEVTSVLGDKNVRPDAIVVAYPVILSNEFTHLGTINVITGCDESKRPYFSLEQKVNKNSSPAFIWATFNDTCVPCENSIELAYAYRRAKVPFELHVYEHCEHGTSLGTLETGAPAPYIQSWFELSVAWLNSNGFKIEK